MLVTDLRDPVQKATGQDKEADPPVCLVSKPAERRSKQECSRIAIAQAAIEVGMDFAPRGKSEHSE